MLTIAALVALGLGAWGALEVARDVRDDVRGRRRPTGRQVIGDTAWFAGCICIVATAVRCLTQ